MSDGVCHLCIDEIVVVAEEVSQTNQSIALCVVKACYCQSCCEKRAVPEAWVHLRTLWPRCRASAAGAKGCVGHWAAVGWGTWSSCLAPQHQPPRPSCVHCCASCSCGVRGPLFTVPCIFLSQPGGSLCFSCQSQGRLCFSVHNFRVSPLCFRL